MPFGAHAVLTLRDFEGTKTASNAGIDILIKRIKNMIKKGTIANSNDFENLMDFLVNGETPSMPNLKATEKLLDGSKVEQIIQELKNTGEWQKINPTKIQIPEQASVVVDLSENYGTSFDVPKESNVGDLKNILAQRTQIPPHQQKLLDIDRKELEDSFPVKNIPSHHVKLIINKALVS